MLHRVAAQTRVAAVVTQPDRPAGRGHKLMPSPVSIAARALGLPVVTPVRLRAFASELSASAPDILVVASYGRILPATLLDVPSSGIAFNVHPSLLPLYRGATPLQSAIRDGRRETGVSVIAMDAGMDTGDLIVAERTPLGADETYGELHDRLARLGAELLSQAIAELAQHGTVVRRPQSTCGVDPAEVEATVTRPFGKEDMVVDWAWPAARIVDLVRAFAPAPAARGVLDGETVKITAARLARAGEFGATSDGGIVVPAGDGAGVVLLRLTPPNRGAMGAAAFMRSRAATA